ncbi:hypothetical protein NKJ23_27505 [Mesorhizobium sp. M0184]|uniref:hypothetical protein n=1 Tax=Mesorhizobium sp. M0184 TaxID=2956906 RepID=UPI0033361CFC
MHEETKRFKERFQASFDQGLENVKFFVLDKGKVSFADLIKDVNTINDTIAAGGFRAINALDGDCETRRFDAAF